MAFAVDFGLALLMQVVLGLGLAERVYVAFYLYAVVHVVYPCAKFAYFAEEAL